MPEFDSTLGSGADTDPSQNTQAFQAFVQRAPADTERPSRRTTGMLVGVLAVIVVVIAIVVVLVVT